MEPGPLARDAGRLSPNGPRGGLPLPLVLGSRPLPQVFVAGDVMSPVRVRRVGQQPVIRIRTDFGTFRTVSIPAPRSGHGMVAVVSLVPRCENRTVQAVDQQIESLWVAVNVIVGASVQNSCHVGLGDMVGWNGRVAPPVLRISRAARAAFA